jgi:hypothetical protein
LHYRSSKTASSQRGPERIDSRRPELAGRVLTFFDRLATVGPEELPLRTWTVTDPEARRRLRADADMEVFNVGWDRELADAQRSIDTWLARLLSHDAPGIAGSLGGGPGLTAADHVAVRLGLHDALLAIILGDRLAERDSQELLGGWADLVIRRR